MNTANYRITKYIDDEEHVCISLHTDHDDQFVSEFLYTVS